MTETYTNKNKLFADGGVIRMNPSPYGGTWAFRIMDGDEVFKESFGIVRPQQFNTLTVSNNVAEMIAVLRGLRVLPDTWTGTVYSDSAITLGRIFRNHKWNGIPQVMIDDFNKTRKRLINWKAIQFTLLSGHPTREQLSTGYGRGERPVSIHNVWCDNMCSSMAFAYMTSIDEKQ